MSRTTIFHIGLIGFSERERRILRSVAALSVARDRQYGFIESGDMSPDIYLIDKADSAANEAWNKQRVGASRPAAFVVDRDSNEVGEWNLRRPIVPAKVFALLDQMTIKELDFLPELHIGREGETATRAPDVNIEPAPSARRALVVDDSPTVRKQMEIGLNHFQISVDFAETGEQALYQLSLKSYDIVFLDVVLPGMDGYQVCRAIKKNNLRKHTPVVMLTGKSSAFDRVKGSLAGCDTYLTKPVANTLFRNVLAKYLHVNMQGDMNSDLGAFSLRPT